MTLLEATASRSHSSASITDGNVFRGAKSPPSLSQSTATSVDKKAQRGKCLITFSCKTPFEIRGHFQELSTPRGYPRTALSVSFTGTLHRRGKAHMSCRGTDLPWIHQGDRDAFPFLPVFPIGLTGKPTEGPAAEVTSHHWHGAPGRLHRQATVLIARLCLHV